ncbi:hypothetical protein KDAU_12330 [Dictyobacter aurantiacus]|uniref:Uncharacterized protein n=1 Tax=Dictyobacter aurantiacus TaxID=1936993 RepID=A0A401ZAK5_9CHLR|nr:hypothetical protein KDAU_12330 [Dictyobacter aurantiacus]
MLPEATLVSTLELLGYNHRNTQHAHQGVQGDGSPHARGLGVSPRIFSLYRAPPQAASVWREPPQQCT